MELEKYKNKLEYPKYSKKPYLPFDHTIEQVGIYKEELIIWDELKKKERELVAKFNQEDERLENEFKKDAFQELGIKDDPKREILWRIAYEKGHSEGFSGIWNEMLGLVDLIV